MLAVYLYLLCIFIPPFLALFIPSMSFFFFFYTFDWRGVVASMRWTNI